MPPLKFDSLNFVAVSRPLRGSSKTENFIFLYDDSPQSAAEVIQTVGRFADNPDLDFTWNDAADVARKVREKRHDIEQSRAILKPPLPPPPKSPIAPPIVTPPKSNTTRFNPNQEGTQL